MSERKTKSGRFYGDPVERFTAMADSAEEGSVDRAHFKMWCRIAADEIAYARQDAPTSTDPMKELSEALEKICAEADKIRQLPPSDSFRDGLVEGLSWARTIARTALENAKGAGHV